MEQPKNTQKRMVYIYEENLAFYNDLENKSEWINDKLQDARINTRVKDETTNNPPTSAPELPTEVENDPDWHPDPRIRDTRRQVKEMEERDAKLRNGS